MTPPAQSSATKTSRSDAAQPVGTPAQTPRRRAIERLAELWGLMPHFRDGEKVIHASDQGLAGALTLLAGDELGIDLTTAKQSTLERVADERAAQLASVWLEPVQVSWADRPPSVFVRPTESFADTVSFTLELESGGEYSWTVPIADMRELQRKTPEGGRAPVRVCEVPCDVPVGYHTLRAEQNGETREALLIRAPRLAWSPQIDAPKGAKRARAWGLFAPGYAVRRATDPGTGDLSHLRELMEWSFEHGARVLATLPMVPIAGHETPLDPSPYGPLSRRYYNEQMLDPRYTPEFEHAPAARAAYAELERAAPTEPGALIDYETLIPKRRAILQHLADRFFETGGEQSERLSSFLAHYPDAREFARFRAVAERHLGWHKWTDARLIEGDWQPDQDYDPAAERLHLYAQMAFTEQLDAFVTDCKERGGMVYLDLPVGVHRGGYDAWRDREVYEHRLVVGAPPDLMFEHGQSWGFSPLKPQALRAARYRPLIEAVQSFMRSADCLRLDHVMGMYRLFVMDRALTPADGLYLRYPYQELFAVLNIESHRHKCRLIGENLGMVPPEVNDALDDHGYGRMYIAQLFNRAKPAHALDPVPRDTVASLNTHDMPPFAAWWGGRDMTDLASIGLLDEPDVAKKEAERAKVTEAVARFLTKKDALDPHAEVDAQAIMHALTTLLARTDAELVLINAEDLWGELNWQNIPGTFKEHPNWRRRWARTLDELVRDEDIAAFLDSITRARTESPIDWPPPPEDKPSDATGKPKKNDASPKPVRNRRAKEPGSPSPNGSPRKPKKS